jgi:hypothetical protein
VGQFLNRPHNLVYFDDSDDGLVGGADGPRSLVRIVVLDDPLGAMVDAMTLVEDKRAVASSFVPIAVAIRILLSIATAPALVAPALVGSGLTVGLSTVYLSRVGACPLVVPIALRFRNLALLLPVD